MTLDPRMSDAELIALAERRTASREKRSHATNRLQRGRKFASLSLTIPFKHLVSDNAKYGVIRGRMLLQADYRQAKETIGAIARRAMKDTLLAEGPVHLHATVHMPDARRRDATNHIKLVHDSLQGIVFADDSQITRATWENAGIDREKPRVELCITSPSRAVAVSDSPQEDA